MGGCYKVERKRDRDRDRETETSWHYPRHCVNQTLLHTDTNSFPAFISDTNCSSNYRIGRTQCGVGQLRMHTYRLLRACEK